MTTELSVLDSLQIDVAVTKVVNMVLIGALLGQHAKDNKENPEEWLKEVKSSFEVSQLDSPFEEEIQKRMDSYVEQIFESALKKLASQQPV